MSIDDDRISGLYREADQPGPSKQLDEAILSASRKALKKPARTGPFSNTWPAVASIAAVVIITVILVPVLVEEEPLPKREQNHLDQDGTAEPAAEMAERYRAAEAEKPPTAARSPAAGTVTAPLQNSLAEEQAIAVSSPAGAPASALRKSSAAADMKQAPADGSAGRSYSRMEVADSAPFAALTPEMWEIRISRLIEAGELEQARTELEKLAQHFPEHRIAPELLQKLGPLPLPASETR